jgi:ubiquinone/menaquinone biosynthesis C-methylase UbiE
VMPHFESGNAAALPLEDASLEFVVCRAAFKNFSEPVKALAEMRRVLRLGGTALVIDMRRDVSVSEIQAYVNSLGVSRWNRWLMMLTFRTILIRRVYQVGRDSANGGTGGLEGAANRFGAPRV